MKILLSILAICFVDVTARAGAIPPPEALCHQECMARKKSNIQCLRDCGYSVPGNEFPAPRGRIPPTAKAIPICES